MLHLQQLTMIKNDHFNEFICFVEMVIIRLKLLPETT